MGRRLSGGLSPLAYTGVRPVTPAQEVIQKRRPTPNDIMPFEIGDWWVIPKKAVGTAGPSKEIWRLVSKVNNQAVWKRLHGGGGPDGTLSVNIQVFDTPGAATYTPTEGMNQCIVECVGGGGGNASITISVDVTPSVAYASTGAGGGGYCKKLFTADDIGASQSLVVGAGGALATTAVPPMTSIQVYEGNDGEDTTFGSFMTAGGGLTPVISMPDYPAFPVGSGGTATGGDINIPGQNGGNAIFDSGVGGYASVTGGVGGNSGMYGYGATNVSSFNNVGLAVGDLLGLVGNLGTGYGSGSSGSLMFATSGAPTPQDLAVDGQAGTSGVVIITEFFA